MPEDEKNKNSALLENIVAVTLHNRYRESLYYFKSSKTGIDIDFFISDTNTAIQVAYSIDGEDRTREVENLLKAAKEFKEVSRYTIVTYEEEGTIEEKGITIDVVPLYKFLLNE